jgi:hypothetical protein
MKHMFLIAATLLVSAVASARVCLYEHADFRGMSRCWESGTRGVVNLGDRLNNEGSSLTITAGEVVTLCQNSNSRGNCATYRRTTRGFDSFYNDTFSSISIDDRYNPRPGPGPGPRPQPNAGRACFYEDADLRGSSFCMTRNQRSVSALSQNWNDRISSVSVPRGMTVVLYSDWRFGGQTKVLRAGNHTLYNFNDVTSSIQVY